MEQPAKTCPVLNYYLSSDVKALKKHYGFSFLIPLALMCCIINRTTPVQNHNVFMIPGGSRVGEYSGALELKRGAWIHCITLRLKGLAN